MATSSIGAVIPVTRATKTRLESVKDGRTFDALLRELLAATPPDELRERLEAREGALVARALARKNPSRRSAGRTASKQLLIARVARERWRLAFETGQLRRKGRRWVEYVVEPGPAEAEVAPRVRFVRRGLAP